MSPNTKKLLKRIATWPKDDQDELAGVAAKIEARRRGPIYRLSDDERAAVRGGLDAARRGDFAPEHEMEEFYRLHRNG